MMVAEPTRLAWLRRLTSIGQRPDDERELRLRKASMVAVSVGVALAATLWVVPFFAMGRPLGAAMPLIYQIVTVIGLVVFARTGRFGPFVSVQAAMWLVLPFGFQWALGGFGSASVVMVWAFLATIAALLYLGTRAALVCFTGYLALLALSAALDPILRASIEPLPEAIRSVFFALNIGGVSATTFLLLLWVDRERRLAHAKTDALLNNVMPAAIAERLKEGEQVIAEYHPDVTVLFADVVDFTPFVEATSAERVVHYLDDLFTAFDRLAVEHALEKIKTIGDAYMVVGGLPEPLRDHPAAAVEMALGMRAALDSSGHSIGRPMQLRIGIATGPVIAGVIGRRRVLYDLWGDTVNLASRMESTGVPGCIQVTAETYARVKDRYAFGRREGVSVKGKGELTTYLLRGPGQTGD